MTSTYLWTCENGHGFVISYDLVRCPVCRGRVKRAQKIEYTTSPVVVYKVLMCGSVEWGDPLPIKREIKRLLRAIKSGRIQAKELVVIHGKAPGADMLSGEIAKELNVHVCEIPALWDTRYRGAGPQRNSIMLSLEPHEVIGFHKNIRKSRGTKDTITKARKLGIKTKVVSK